MLDTLSKKLLVAGTVFYLVVTVCSMHLPFFWDTILTSTVAQWFYDHGIQNVIAPLKWDAGHPTLLQLYLMTSWKLFGKTLPVSHFSMLPFLVLMVGSYVYIMQRINLSSGARIFGLVALLLHPYILTQSTLVSYDILQIAFFLTVLAGIIDNKKTWLLAGIWGLSACSIRGQMIAVVCLGCYLLFDLKNLKHHFLFCVVAVLPLVSWHYYHYLQTGWMISTPSDSWETHRDVAGLKQIISNTVGIVRGFVDYGIVALSLLFTYALFTTRKLKKSAETQKILIVTALVFAVMGLSIMMFSNPVGHRYFMVIHVGMLLFVVAQWTFIRAQKIWPTFISMAFISGHFWLYPAQISNGWDVTLKYVSYEQNRKAFLNYLSDSNIPPEEIASAFPLFCSQQQTNLTEGKRLLDITETKVLENKYVAYSSVCNDMRGLHVPAINRHYHIIQIFGEGKTAIILYKNHIN